MANFLDLPSELRNQVYGLCLLHQEPIDPQKPIFPWIGHNPRLKLTPGLFRTNKKVHLEASSFFYAQNCFNFNKATAEEVALFLGTIGRRNAGYIQHIYLNFPYLRDLEPGNVTLEDHSFKILAKIQSSCTKLSTLTTSLYSTNDMMLKLEALDYPKIVSEALTLVNTHFRAILSLQNIVVNVYENDLSEYIKKEMESYGWKVNTTEYVKEKWDTDRSFSDDEDDWRYDYGYGDEDGSYDIDNDSDFWRRAGD